MDRAQAQLTARERVESIAREHEGNMTAQSDDGLVMRFQFPYPGNATRFRTDLRRIGVDDVNPADYRPDSGQHHAAVVRLDGDELAGG